MNEIIIKETMDNDTKPMTDWELTIAKLKLFRLCCRDKDRWCRL